MLSHLKSLIGAEHWPSFEPNLSEQYEARFSMVKLEASSSVLLADMAGSYLPRCYCTWRGTRSFC